MEIKSYEKEYKNQVISLILFVQNYENKVDVSFEEQPDINNKVFLQNKVHPQKSTSLGIQN